jgi:hypothetical protein
MKPSSRDKKADQEGGTLPARQEDLVRRAEACRALVADFDSLLLSTVAADGSPELSYAPFVTDEEGAFWIFISDLAPHTRHLLAEPRCALLFIREEGASPNLFARERLSLRCRAHPQDRNSERGRRMLAVMENRFGGTMALLRSLADFRLFRIEPHHGRYVAGFGRAFDWNPRDGSLTPVEPG